MTDDILTYLKEVEFNEPANADEITAVEKKTNIDFPKEYKEFLEYSNGAEGPVGEESYISLWRVGEIAELNKEYGVLEFMPSLIYFGSDGGEMAYAFDKSNDNSIVEVPFDSIHIEDANILGNTFNEFIETLFNYKYD